MEFDFNINYLFGDTITKLDHRVTPYRKNANGYDYITLRKQLYQVIDCMGDASARAQGLHGPITLARKLELSDHILYVMKDAGQNSGKGAVVGILKIGHKRLFVYDSLGHQHEMEPLCVLDFYVHESRQRMGCGKRLFDYFLKDQNVNPKHLAIDKPSFKFSSFLNKHYNLKAVVPQVNNFVVFEGFFNGRTDTQQNRRNGKPPTHPARGRYYYRHDDHIESDVIMRRPNGVNSAHNWRREERPPSGRFSKASNKTCPSRNDEYPNSFASRPLSGQEQYNVALNERLIPRVDLEQPTTTAERALGAKANQYSRHGSTPPGSRPSSNTQTSNNPRPPSNPQPNSKTDINRVHNKERSRPDSPPLLNRNGPHKMYADLLNLHQDYQGRSGHMKYGPESNIGSLPQIQQKPSPSPNSFYSNSPSWRTRTDYNWTVHGPAQNHHTISQRHYTHTRLW